MSHPFSLVKTDSDWTERRDSKLTKKMLSQKKKKTEKKKKGKFAKVLLNVL